MKNRNKNYTHRNEPYMCVCLYIEFIPIESHCDESQFKDLPMNMIYTCIYIIWMNVRVSSCAVLELANRINDGNYHIHCIVGSLVHR